MAAADIVISVAAGASQLPLIRQAVGRGYRVLGIDADPSSSSDIHVVTNVSR